MSSTVRILFLSRRTKLNKEGLSTINIRVTIDGKSVEFSTKIFIDPSFWNPGSGRMSGKSKTALEINNSLNAMLARLKIQHREILDRNGSVTAEELRDVFLNKTGLRYTLLGLFEAKIAQKMCLKGTTIKEATIANYIRTKNRLEEFIKIKYNKEDVAIQAVDNGFITGFESFLRIQYKNDDNTVVNNLRRVKQVTNQAFKKRYMNIDPFDGIKLSSKRGKRYFLTENELKRILWEDFKTDTLSQVRDFFVFCCLTGLGYADVSNLKAEDIRENAKGEKYLLITRVKSGVEAYIPLLAVPLAILDKYTIKKPSAGELLPIRHCQNLNTCLKKIAKICNINKRLTTHVGRHTFSTLMLTKGISIESVSKMLGHTDIKTTQIYAQILNEKVDTEINRIKAEFNNFLKHDKNG